MFEKIDIKNARVSEINPKGIGFEITFDIEEEQPSYTCTISKEQRGRMNAYVGDIYNRLTDFWKGASPEGFDYRLIFQGEELVAIGHSVQDKFFLLKDKQAINELTKGKFFRPKNLPKPKS